MTSALRVVIADDEPIARAGLRVLLADDPTVAIVGECADGRSAIEVIQRERPNLVFLDVQMPDVDGFDVVRALDLPNGESPVIVFVTAYDRYAIRAFEVNAIDYILKPFDDERFAAALSRAKRAVLDRGRDSAVERVEQLERLLTEVPRMMRFVVKTGGRVVFVPADEIDWIEAADYYVKLHVGKTTHMLRATMSALEAQLDPATFFRAHRSAIVNVSRVRELLPWSKHERILMLQDGTRLRINRRRSGLLEALLGTTLTIPTAR
ncbi:MAG TPA: LytTR family DNA-binding domain-containing protein [Gemmatimonadaceae bacterium]|nr:LytTR family DNA-binding domain-containing protein [Gemmatimonadaceae bacterium]